MVFCTQNHRPYITEDVQPCRDRLPGFPSFSVSTSRKGKMERQALGIGSRESLKVGSGGLVRLLWFLLGIGALDKAEGKKWPWRRELLVRRNASECP